MDYKKWIIRFFWIILVLSLCEGNFLKFILYKTFGMQTEIINIFRKGSIQKFHCNSILTHYIVTVVIWHVLNYK